MSTTIEYEAFAVDEQMHCIWHTNLWELNREFLGDLDPTYFQRVGDLLLPHLENNETAQCAALTVRTLFSQAVETLFSFIFTALQAPHVPIGWLLRYRPGNLPTLVRKFKEKQPFPTVIKVEFGSWLQLSYLFNPFSHDDPKQGAALKQGFAEFWSGLAEDFLNQDTAAEYNSLKHGLRVRPSGFTAALGVVLFHSSFGTSFPVAKSIGRSKSAFYVERCWRNWEPANMCVALSQISFSLRNIISFIRALRDENDVHFETPVDPGDFNALWSKPNSGGGLRMGGLRLNEEDLPKLGQEDLKQLYKKRRIEFEIITAEEVR